MKKYILFSAMMLAGGMNLAGMEYMPGKELKAEKYYANNFSLTELPKETIINILSYLTEKNINNCSPCTLSKSELIDIIFDRTKKLKRAEFGDMLKERLSSAPEATLLDLYDSLPHMEQMEQLGQQQWQNEFGNELLNEMENLNNTIKTFMRLSVTCKNFNELLTFEKIGEFCKYYSRMIKTVALHDVKKLNFDEHYISKRLPVLILVCAGADANEKDYEGHPLYRYAVEHNDTQLVALLFNHQVNPNHRLRLLTSPLTITPIFFYAKTIKMAQLLVDNGINIHATGNRGNVVWHIIDDSEYPAELVEFYIKHHVDSCLLHTFIKKVLKDVDYHHEEDGFYSKTELLDEYYRKDNYSRKGKLLLNATPDDMINALNNKGQTPLDVLHHQLDNEEMYDDEEIDKEKIYQYFLTHVPFFALLRQRGGKTSQELFPNENLKDISVWNKPLKTVNKSTASQSIRDTEECRCTIF